MVTTAEHQTRLNELFRAEAREHLAEIHKALHRTPPGSPGDHEALKGALRAAHSLKGGATVAGHSTLSGLVHNWESCLGVVVSGDIALDEEALDLLFRAVDVASDELEAHCDGFESDEGALRAVMTELGDRFGDHCELKTLDFATRERGGSARRSVSGTIRVDTRKLDRHMATIEELLRLKAGGQERLTDFSKNLSSMEKLCSKLSELRQKTRVLAKRDGSASVSELAQSLGALLDAARDVTASYSSATSEIRKTTHALSLLSDALHADARVIRMLPVDTAFGSFSRMVRDVARSCGKKVALELTGGDTEVDRDVLDVVKDPVMHLLRNAVDHGVEAPEVRRALGKPEEAKIRIHARSSAGLLELEIADDGRGVTAAAVGEAAVARGVATESEVAQMDADSVRALIFREGFSTATDVTDVSGRGVGLAVVETAVDQIGGRVSFSTVEGAGTSFRLALPLNLSTTRLLLVTVGGHEFAIPALAVDRIVRMDRASLVRVDSGLAFELGGKPVAVCSLSDALEVPGSSIGERLLAVVVASASERCAFVVDGITHEMELVARKLSEHLAGVPNVSGVAVLPQGGLAPILNVADLLRSSRRAPDTAFDQKDARAVVARRVLVVDDSLTTRILEKSILEAAGYEVETAVDGAEALAAVKRARFDLVLSDVQMPNVDGLTLVRTLKQDLKTRRLPIVLVSSLDTEEQRRQGLDAGADAYLSKGEFEQGLLLSTLERFV